MSASGRITVSSRAALELIEHIISEYDGIAALAAPSRSEELLHMLRGGFNNGSVYITKTKVGLTADIYVSAKYGAAADELRGALAGKIKKELKDYLHMSVSEINVHVKGAVKNGD